MSTLASEALGSSVTGDITSSSTLLPTVTRVDARAEVNPVSVVLAVSVVFILAPITISGNTMILAAFYRYKRLRTASNCLLASLAVSDFGVGVFMPFGMHLELSGLPDNAEVSTLCIAPYCVVIALCSVSVLVTVAIAVDRLTSLAQPLRYKNIITHSSVEKYIAVFWLYAIGVGLSPLIYAQIMGLTQTHSGSCRFGAAVLPPVRVFLVVAVWAPSALVLLGCYMYVYLVARAHARAIYTVELSFRHQTQTLALPRYGQTLALTVGAFLVLWLPFQACMLLDIFCGTKILSEWAVVWLGLPILAHSGANPWIYAFHHGEMRVAATKIAEDVVTRFGIHPSRYGCSPVRRGSNTNLELAEVNKSSETRRPPVEDCFAAKHQSSFYSRDKIKCAGELGSNNTDISPEGIDSRRRFSAGSLAADIVEEDIHDLTKMLRPEYAVDRNLLIDSNHNIDKIKNLKYLLDPTFNKIRHLRRLNHKRTSTKTFARFEEPKFTSYQNLKSQMADGRKTQLNAMSDPVLNVESPVGETEDLAEVLCQDPVPRGRRNSNLSSMSDPNIKSRNVPSASSKICNMREVVDEEDHGYSVQSLDTARCDLSSARHALQCRRVDNLKKLQCRPRGFISSARNNGFEAICRDLQLRGIAKITDRLSPNFKHPVRQITLTTNKLANFFHPDHERMRNANPEQKLKSCTTRLGDARARLEFLKHSESISAIERTAHSGLLEPSRFMDSLTVPTIHSEPPSPVEPLPLDSLKEEESPRIFSKATRASMIDRASGSAPRRRFVPANFSRSPSRMSDPTIPFVLLNVEDFSTSDDDGRTALESFDPSSPSGWPEVTLKNVPFAMAPEDLAEALLMSTERRPSGTIFTEHDSTRFSSRRPSDLRWSESSRSQEVLSNVNEHHKSPSSYSVNNFESCTSGSDLNDVTCLGSFICPDPLTSSLRESFFEAPSVPDSDVFTSSEDLENRDASPEPSTKVWPLPMVHSSVSSVNFARSKACKDIEINQSKSSESVLKNHAILRLESSVHRNRLRVRPGKDCILNDPPVKRNPVLAPLATPTPMEICTPTFDTAAEMKGASGVGVRV